MKSTKKSLLASGLSLLACCALLIGTTFAWFTDSASNTGNRIQAGSLNVELLKAGTGDEGYKNISDGSGDIFSGGSWEPNKTQIVYLAIQNNGTLAASVDLTVINTPEGNVNLGDVLQCAVIEGVDPTNPITADSWDELIEGLTSGINYFKKLGDSRAPIQDRVLTAGETLYFALAVHMNWDAENKYQNAACTIDVLVHADQATVEDDAFGTDYDADVAYSIDTDQELKDALTRPENGAVYTVNADVTISKITPSESAKFTLDLNGHTVTLSGPTGIDLSKAAFTMTVTDSSDDQNGKLLHTGTGFMFVSAFDDTVVGNGYLASEGKGLSNSGNVVND